MSLEEIDEYLEIISMIDTTNATDIFKSFIQVFNIVYLSLKMGLVYIANNSLVLTNFMKGEVTSCRLKIKYKA